MPLLRLNNPLAYPAGVRPGVLWGSPALTNAVLQFSAVASGNTGTTATFVHPCGFVAVYPKFQIAQTSNVGSSVSNVIDPYIGPSISVGLSGTQAANFSGQTTATLASIILGTIFTTGSSVSALQFVVNTGGIVVEISATGLIEVGIPFGTLISSGVTATVNTPYAVWLSITTGAQAFVIVNLATGKTSTATASTAITMPAQTGNTQIGDYLTDGDGFGGHVATFMFASGRATVSELLPLASRPWDFWYPPTVQNLILTSLQGPQSTALSLSGWSMVRGGAVDAATIRVGLASETQTIAKAVPAAAYRISASLVSHAVSSARVTQSAVISPIARSEVTAKASAGASLASSLTARGQSAAARARSAASLAVAGTGSAVSMASSRAAVAYKVALSGLSSVVAPFGGQFGTLAVLAINASTQVVSTGRSALTISGQLAASGIARASTSARGTVALALSLSARGSVLAASRIAPSIASFMVSGITRSISTLRAGATLLVQASAAAIAMTSSRSATQGPLSYFFNRFRSAIGARSGTHQQDK